MSWTVYNSDGQILQGSSTLADDAVTTAKIIDDAVTYVKMQNLATADRVLGSTSTGVIGEVQIVPDMLATDAVTNVKVATGIDAVKLADGSVTNAELQYINTLSSNAQTQLTAKQATIDSSARLDAASIGANGNVSNTEYGYLSGVTSDIQTQLNAAGGAVTRDGGDSTETTTTSTSLVDLLTQASMTIGPLKPLGIVFVTRKTAGAGSRTQGGFDLNGANFHIRNAAGTENQIENGNILYWLPPRLASYLRAGASSVYTSLNAAGGSRFTDVNSGTQSADFPTGNVTDVTAHGKTDSASQTLGMDELHIHSKSSS